MTRRDYSCVGRPVSRVDADVKVRGDAAFLSDLRFPDMWEAAVATPSVAHAVVRGVRVPTTAADGIVLVAADIPGINEIGIARRDQPLLVTDRVRSAGDRLAIVAAPTRAAAAALANAVTADLEPLPVVEDVEQAISPGAPLIHQGGNIAARLRVTRGDIDEVWAKADVIIQGVYRTGWQEHAYLEPQGAVAVPEGDGRMVVYSTCQCPFYVRGAVADVLGRPQSMVRVLQTFTGGAFGGKEDYPSEVAACAALLAQASRRPVRLVYDREDDFRWSTKRHRTVISHRLAANSAGRMLGMQIEALYDAGAYAGLSVVVAERGNSSACGPYELEAVDVRTSVVYTNGLFGGAFRGFGAPQVTFATERQVDELARRLGMDPVSLRRMNLWRSGSIAASGEVLRGRVAVIETLQRAVRVAGYRRRRRGSNPPEVLRGVGVATSYYGNNLHKGGERLDRGHARVTINADGSVNVAVGLTEMGQGLLTAVAQIVAEELGVRPGRVVVAHVDTDTVQDSGPTVASRGTIMSGMPARRAAAALRRRMLRAARRKGVVNPDIRREAIVDRLSNEAVMTWDDLVGLCHAERVEMSATGFYHPPLRPFDPATGQGRPYAVNSYTTHVAEVQVDSATGLVRLLRVTAVHDVGRVVFPEGLRGQIEGGIVQGAGCALSECLVAKEGVLRNPGFADYAIPGIADTPEIRMEVIEHPWKGGPFGAKGIGEPSLIGVPAAIANAVSDALKVTVTEIPLTPERVLGLLQNRK